jgi:AraC-like DNA-binding protein
MAYKKDERLTAEEKEQLREAIEQLLSLDWTQVKLSRYLGYRSRSPVCRALNEGGGMRRDRYEKVMSLVEDCTLASEVDLPDASGRSDSAEKRVARSEHADDLCTQLQARGVSLEQIARALGYRRPARFEAALRRRSLPEDRYRSLTAFADMVLKHANGSRNGNGRDDHGREAVHPAASNERSKHASRPARNGRPETNGRKAANGVGTKPGRDGKASIRRVHTGIPVFEFLEAAREELDDAASTLKRAHDEAANALTGPGIQRFRGEILKIRKQIDEVLAMQ